MAPGATATDLPPPAFLCGFPKSGTTLLRGLLDGHPDLLVLPVEVRLFRVLKNASPDEWLPYLLERTGVRRLANHSKVIPEHAKPFEAIDEEAYAARVGALWEASERSPRDLMESVVRAFAEATGQSGRKLWIEKSPEQELVLERMTAWWPDLRVVHIVRDPRSTFAAFRKKRQVRGADLQLEPFVVRWNTGLRAAERHAATHPTLILRFEDLLRDTRPTLDRLCAFLGIGWDDALLRPTMNGLPWGGNSMFGEEHEGISDAPAERWRTELSPAEVEFVEIWLADAMRRYGYDSEVARTGLVSRVRSLLTGGDRGLRDKLRMLRDLRGA